MAEEKNVPLIHFNAYSWDIILCEVMKYYVKIGLIMSVYLDPNLTSGGHDAVGGIVPPKQQSLPKQHEKSVPRLRWIPVWPSNKVINVSLGCRHFINSIGIP